MLQAASVMFSFDELEALEEARELLKEPAAPELKGTDAAKVDGGDGSSTGATSLAAEEGAAPAEGAPHSSDDSSTGVVSTAEEGQPLEAPRDETEAVDDAPLIPVTHSMMGPIAAEEDEGPPHMAVQPPLMSMLGDLGEKASAAKSEEDEQFQAAMDMEIEVERRMQLDEDWEDAPGRPGVPGASFTIAVPTEAAQPEGPTVERRVVDCANEQLRGLGVLTRRRVASARCKEILGRLLPLVYGFLNNLMHIRFLSTAAGCFKDFILRGYEPCGLVPVIEEWCDLRRRPTTSRALELEAMANLAVQRMADALGKVLQHGVGEPASKRELLTFLAGEHVYLVAAVQDRTPGIAPLPTPAPDQAVEVVLKTVDTDEELSLTVPAGLTVDELRILLIECRAFPPRIRLCRRHPETGLPVPHPLASRLYDVGPMVVVEGVAQLAPKPVQATPELRRCPMDDKVYSFAEFRCRYMHPSFQLAYESADLLESWKSFEVVEEPRGGAAQTPGNEEARCSRWYFPWRILRTTPITMTRCLVALRTKFAEVNFQVAYSTSRKNARPGDTTHIERALAVQQQIIPQHGFAGTVGGVSEMRAETDCHVKLPDVVLYKVMKDIHKLLDYGEPLQKIPTVKALEPLRFPAEDTDAWLAHLADEGFAVIRGAVSAEEVRVAYDLLWHFIESSDQGGRVKRHDVETWEHHKRKDHGWPAGMEDGIIHGRGIGQSEVLWYLRALPKVQQVFADLWGTPDLVPSFDGACVFRPYGHHRSWKATRRNWNHVDQAQRKRGLHCVQGLITLKDATIKTGGLVVVPQSHRFHEDILTRYPGTGSWNFIGLKQNDPVLTEGESRPRLVCAEAGDLILWDSRTVHCSTQPLVEDQGLLRSNDLIRAVAYVSMTPAAWCSDEVVIQRSAAFERAVTCSHWPHEFYPMDYGTVKGRSFTLNEIQRRLLCPQTAPRWQPSGKEAPPEGRISVRPKEYFTVVSHDVPVRSVATTEWGEDVGVLQAGTQVSGYAFGKWLRLEDKPATARPDGVGDSESRPSTEEWVFMGDDPRSPHLVALKRRS